MLWSDGLSAVSNHLWQSTLFAAAAWAMTLLLRRQQARVRYAVWMAASLKFLLPLALLVSWGSSMRSASRVVPAMPVVEQSMQTVAQPFTSDEASAVAVEPRAPVKDKGKHTWLVASLFAAWGLGAMCLASLWGREWQRLRGVVRQAAPVELCGEVPVYLSQTRMEPGVFGVLRPVIVLPAGMQAQLSGAQMEALMVHEMEHVRRRDNLTAMLHMAVQAVFWFHPMVWWIRNHLLEERELACDEAVLRAQADPHLYAESILAVCRGYVAMPVLHASGMTGAELKRRLAHILRGGPAERLGCMRLAGLLGLLLVAVFAPLSLGMLRVHAASVFAHAEETQAAQMAAIPHVEFEVATVKLNTLGVPPYGPPPMTNVDLDPGDLYEDTHGLFRVRNKSLRTLIAFAYKMSGDQQNYLKHHVPDFVLNERFDVDAKTDKVNATKDEMRAMVRSLLEQRFGLKVHTETIETNIYAMVQSTAGKFGPQMRIHPADDATCDQPPPEGRLQMPKDGYPPMCGVVVGLPNPHPPTETKSMITVGGRNVPLSLVAAALVAPYTGDTGLQRTVVDMTGVNQNVDFVLNLGYDEMEPTFTPNTAPWFPTELQEQLGLKLKGQKGPIHVYIVDHVEHLIPE